MPVNPTHRSRCASACLGVALCTLLSGTWAVPVGADDFSAAATVYGFSGLPNMDQKISVGMGNEEPGLLRGRDMFMSGRPTWNGGGVQLLVETPYRLRFTFDEIAFGISGAELRGAGGELAPGIRRSGSSAWGATFAFGVGKSFPLSWVTPYVDARFGIDVLSVDIRLRSTSYGLLGQTNYDAVAWTLTPRVGAKFPLGDAGFVDMSVGYGVVGPDRFSATLGIGMYIAGRPTSPATF
jgi:hypothetical protein